eukprot:1838839-Rhodomonas_salina.1
MENKNLVDVVEEREVLVLSVDEGLHELVDVVDSCQRQPWLSAIGNEVVRVRLAARVLAMGNSSIPATPVSCLLAIWPNQGSGVRVSVVNDWQLRRVP